MKEDVKLIAKICHEANKVYCESIGDTSQVEWKDAPEWQKESAVNGVKYHLDNPDSRSEDSHNSWMKEKIDNGWVYGEVKDPEAKTHPCIVPFYILSKEQQFKDILFTTIVKTFANHL